MATRLSVAQIVERWAQNGAGSGETVRAGVNAVTNNPMEAAANNAAGYLRGVQAAVQSGKYEASLRAVSLSDWKTAMINKGIPNMQTGYTQGRAKFNRFMTEFLPYAREVGATIRSMPRGTLQQSIDRSRRAIELMHEFGQRRAGGGLRPSGG